MPTPITMTQVAQYQPYCTQSDVTNLIGNVINNSTFNTAAISTYISEAVRYIDRETNGFFSPRRMRTRQDGNARSRIVNTHPHIMAINELDVFFTYPLTLSRVAYEWDLLIDREAGVISFPTYTASPVFAPFAFTFYPASLNVEIDAWYGYNKQIYGEQLTTSDHLIYTFANPTVIKQATQVAYPYQYGQAPQLVPIIYKNGTALTNTTYVLAASPLDSASNIWQIQSDNLIYTLNAGSNGITSVTFNSANSSNDVITADYVYWYIPVDIQMAAAKRAASTVLSAIASAPFDDNSYNGFDMVMMDSFKLQSSNGQFGALISRWQSEIDEVVKRNHQISLDFAGGYIPEVTGGWSF